MRGRVLIVAGSDSGGGAGIQADIKTVTALGGYASTALTALTAQNTTGVQAIHEVPTDFIAQQMGSVLGDIGADAVKIGMLHRSDVITTVARVLAEKAPQVPLVLDPVMVAKGGAALLEDAATQALVSELLPRATLLTPNAPEAAAITGRPVDTTEDARAAGAALLGMGPKAVLMKGGHLAGETLTDLLLTEDGEPIALESRRIDSRHTHGTGCTLASACAVGLAQGMDLEAAVRRAHAYVAEAIRTAPGYGTGHGPLNHGHTVRDFEG